MKKVMSVIKELLIVAFIWGLVVCCFRALEENLTIEEQIELNALPITQEEQAELNSQYEETFEQDMEAISNWFKSLVPHKSESIVFDEIITMKDFVDEVESNPMLSNDKYCNNIVHLNGHIGTMYADKQPHFYFNQGWCYEMTVYCTADQMRLLTCDSNLVLTIQITEITSGSHITGTLIDITE